MRSIEAAPRVRYPRADTAVPALVTAELPKASVVTLIGVNDVNVVATFSETPADLNYGTDASVDPASGNDERDANGLLLKGNLQRLDAAKRALFIKDGG
jgi:hypothetical protein